MIDLAPNSLASYLANPLFDCQDISHVPVHLLAEQIKAFKASAKNEHPETDAITFYYLNHAFHVIKSRFDKDESLPPDIMSVVEDHIVLTNQVAKRLFFYAIMIALEEARFMHDQKPEFFEFLGNGYGQEFKAFAKKNFAINNDRSLTCFEKLPMTCGRYAAGMVSVFAAGKWQPGFGGKGWVPIASLVSSCINGSISFENMADQAFSLSHNNGSMFNKGHLYHCYSPFIYNLLDIQDSGQIPQWVNANQNNKFVSAHIRKAHAVMCKHFPEEFTGKLDTSRIQSSEKKRAAKAAALAKQQQAMWNQPSYGGSKEPEQPKVNPMAAGAAILFPGAKKP